MKLGNYFKLIGYKEDIPNFLSSLDIYAQPSWWEGLGIAVIEAMASSLPIVATDVGGIPESIVPEQSGFLVRPGFPSLLAEKILYLIENPESRKTMGQHGRLIAQAKYSIENMIYRIESFLENVILSKQLKRRS
jgi:glycosyltransferase involved in cell wall biosynthesis